MNYIDLGFNNYFEKEAKQSIPLDTLPQIPEVILDNIIQEISGSKIVGGKFSSKNGKLSIDLEKGQLTYNNGASNVVVIGGSEDEVTITTS